MMKMAECFCEETHVKAAVSYSSLRNSMRIKSISHLLSEVLLEQVPLSLKNIRGRCGVMCLSNGRHHLIANSFKLTEVALSSRYTFDCKLLCTSEHNADETE